MIKPVNLIPESHRKDCLKSHVSIMHKEGDRQRKETCIQCNKSYYNKSQVSIYKISLKMKKIYKAHFQLNTHIKTVHEKIKFALCNYCGKSFYTAKDLEMHEKRHFEKQEKCPECDGLFYCKVDLRRHVKTKHTRPCIPCDYPDCGRKFHSNFKLKFHMKTIHDKIKEYACTYSYCERKFGQYNNLKRHIDTVHKALRINCVVDDCKYSVSRKDKFKSHLLTHKDLDDQQRKLLLKSVKYA